MTRHTHRPPKPYQQAFAPSRSVSGGGVVPLDNVPPTFGTFVDEHTPLPGRTDLVGAPFPVPIHQAPLSSIGFHVDAPLTSGLDDVSDSKKIGAFQQPQHPAPNTNGHLMSTSEGLDAVELATEAVLFDFSSHVSESGQRQPDNDDFDGDSIGSFNGESLFAAKQSDENCINEADKNSRPLLSHTSIGKLDSVRPNHLRNTIDVSADQQHAVLRTRSHFRDQGDFEGLHLSALCITEHRDEPSGFGSIVGEEVIVEENEQELALAPTLHQNETVAPSDAINSLPLPHQPDLVAAHGSTASLQLRRTARQLQNTVIDIRTISGQHVVLDQPPGIPWSDGARILAGREESLRSGILTTIRPLLEFPPGLPPPGLSTLSHLPASEISQIGFANIANQKTNDLLEPAEQKAHPPKVLCQVSPFNNRKNAPENFGASDFAVPRPLSPTKKSAEVQDAPRHNPTVERFSFACSSTSIRTKAHGHGSLDAVRSPLSEYNLDSHKLLAAQDSSHCLHRRNLLGKPDTVAKSDAHGEDGKEPDESVYGESAHSAHRALVESEHFSKDLHDFHSPLTVSVFPENLDINGISVLDECDLFDDLSIGSGTCRRDSEASEILPASTTPTKHESVHERLARPQLASPDVIECLRGNSDSPSSSTRRRITRSQTREREEHSHRITRSRSRQSAVAEERVSVSTPPPRAAHPRPSSSRSTPLRPSSRPKVRTVKFIAASHTSTLPVHTELTVNIFKAAPFVFPPNRPTIDSNIPKRPPNWRLLPNLAKFAVEPVWRKGEDPKERIQGAVEWCSRAEFQCLRPPLTDTEESDAWLNANVIDAYIRLIRERRFDNENYLKVWQISSQDYDMVMRNEANNRRRWIFTPAKNMWEQDLIVLPFISRKHWRLLVCHVDSFSIHYLDSAKGHEPGTRFMGPFMRFLNNERKRQKLPHRSFEKYTRRDIPLQSNKYDCGMFVLAYVDFLMSQKPLTFSQHDIPDIRARVAYELLNGELIEE